MSKENQNSKTELDSVFKIPTGKAQGKIAQSDPKQVEPSPTEEWKEQVARPDNSAPSSPEESPYKIHQDFKRAPSAQTHKEPGSDRDREKSGPPSQPPLDRTSLSKVAEAYSATLQRIKEQPAGLIIFAIPLLVVIYVISLFWSGTPTPKAKDSIEPQLPVWDQPPVDDKPVDREEVARLFRKSTAALAHPKEIRDPDYSGLQAKPPASGGAGGPGRAASDSNLGVAPMLPLTDYPSGKPKAATKRKAATAPPAIVEDAEDADRRIRLEKLKRLSAADFQDGVTIPIPGSERSSGDPAGGAAAQPRAGQIQPGTTVSARLEIGVSTDSQSQVVAKLLEPVKDLGGAVVIPAGSTITGTSRAGNERVFLDFNRVTTPTGMKIYFKGYAASGKKPGIPTKVSGSGDSRAGKNLSRATVETAKDVADRIPGADLAGDFARHVARGTADDLEDEARPANDKTLELAPGLEFQVVITSKE